MRGRNAAIAVSTLTVAAALVGCDADGADPNTLRVGTEGTCAPFSFRGADGEVTGYDIEVIEAIGERLGMRVEYRPALNRPALFSGLRSRRVDLVGNHVAPTLPLSEQYELSRYYAEARPVILTRPGEDLNASVTEMSGRNAAYWDCGNWSDGIDASQGTAKVTVESLDHAVRLTKDGHIDATVTDSMAVADYLTRTADDNLVATGITPPFSLPQTFVTRKNDPVMDEVDRALIEIRADCALHAISEKYFGTGSVLPEE